MSKVSIEIEYLLKTSAHILYNCMSTPSGLEEWFAPEVHIKGEVYTFLWEGEERSAKLVNKKRDQMVRYQWIDESDNSCNYFEMRIHIDEMTGELALIINDFADKGEEEDQRLLWDECIDELKRHIGC